MTPAQERRELRRALAQNRRDLTALERAPLCRPCEGPCVCGAIDRQIRERQKYIAVLEREVATSASSAQHGLKGSQVPLDIEASTTIETPASSCDPDARYVVVSSGSSKRPYVVKDTQGGWDVYGSASLANAQKRADELNRDIVIAERQRAEYLAAQA